MPKFNYGVHLATIIRLARFGRKHYPTYRITVADSRRCPTGKFLEQVGSYNPNLKPPSLAVKEESAIKWLMTGAQMSKTVQNLFYHHGTLEKWEQVKAGKTFVEATSTPIEWPKKEAKLSRKKLEKEKQKLEAEKEAAQKAQEEAKATVEAAKIAKSEAVKEASDSQAESEVKNKAE